mmetsp:Transcript_16289/g.41292  ORF Transcript_16289/g.41292 Transcript_16289/m.41292 type:complete len:84 (+) Transcript_16289:1037-1288(+)
MVRIRHGSGRTILCQTKPEKTTVQQYCSSAFSQQGNRIRSQRKDVRGEEGERRKGKEGSERAKGTKGTPPSRSPNNDKAIYYK